MKVNHNLFYLAKYWEWKAIWCYIGQIHFYIDYYHSNRNNGPFKIHESRVSRCTFYVWFGVWKCTRSKKMKFGIQGEEYWTDKYLVACIKVYLNLSLRRYGKTAVLLFQIFNMQSCKNKVITMVTGCIRISTCDIAFQTGLNRSEIWCIITDKRLHPFHLVHVQHLLPSDNNERKEFCEWIIQHMDMNDPIMYSDKA